MMIPGKKALALLLCLLVLFPFAAAEEETEETIILDEEDAEKLKEIIETEYHRKVDLITGIGSVIGAHSGPGTLALFFRGSKR